MKIFLSHSSHDKPFVRRLATDLKIHGHDIFFDEWVIELGASIPLAISKGLESADCVVVALTEHAVASNWVNDEWMSAYWDFMAGREVRLIPALVESCEIPILLRKRRYVDFRDSYDEALLQLVADLSKPSDRASAKDTSADRRGLELERLPPAAAQLGDCMSDISENSYHASWYSGLEYTLWNAVLKGPMEFGQSRITAQHISMLKYFSNACGGWIAWDDDRGGRSWIPLEAWESHYADWKNNPLEGRVFIDRSAEGTRTPVYGFVDNYFRSNWKREALFFDRIATRTLTYDLSEPDVPQDVDPPISRQMRLLVKLVEAGVILPSTATSPAYPRGDAEKALSDRVYALKWEGREHELMFARLTSLQFARKHGADAYPIYDAFPSFSLPSEGIRESALRVIFGRLPQPLPTVGWKRIIEFRNDPESKRHFAALRYWLRQVVKRSLSATEIAEEVEHLLWEFQRHLKQHRLDYSLSPMEAILTCDPQHIDALASQTPLYKQRAGLEFSEVPLPRYPDGALSVPGQELAYIMHARRHFAGGEHALR